MAPEALLLGIDIGTGSSKGVLARPDGGVVAAAETPHDVSCPHPGWAEHDAEDVWWRDVVTLCHDLVTEPVAGRVAGVAVSGVGPALLPADADGRPLRPAILYGIDTRAMDEVAELTARLEASAQGNSSMSASVTGGLSADSVAPKLAWLRRHEPDVFARARHLFMPQSFIVHRLTGAYTLDPLSASACLPLYDQETNAWVPRWTRELAPEIAWPALAWPGDLAGRVHGRAAALTGLPEGTPVAVGTRDSYGDAMSVGIDTPGEALLIYGSTMTVIVVTADVGLPYVVPGTRNITYATATSGSLTRWLRDVVDNVDFATLVDEARHSPPGAHGLLVLPYFAGERSPLADADARGIICGLTVQHTRGDLYRALLEGTAYAMRHIMDEAARAGAPVTHTYAVGGGTGGGLWPQIVSDVTGVTQDLTAVSMGACYGDALLAGRAAGIVPPGVRWADVTARVTPDPSTTARYTQLYALYRQLHPATVDVQHQLAALQRG